MCGQKSKKISCQEEGSNLFTGGNKWNEMSSWTADPGRDLLYLTSLFKRTLAGSVYCPTMKCRLILWLVRFVLYCSKALSKATRGYSFWLELTLRALLWISDRVQAWTERLTCDRDCLKHHCNLCYESSSWYDDSFRNYRLPNWLGSLDEIPNPNVVNNRFWHAAV